MTQTSQNLPAFAACLAGAREEETAGEDILIVVAHPDDETIGIGGQLRRLRKATLVHVTDGAPRNGVDARAHGFDTPKAYADARRRELEAAMAEAGVPEAALLRLDLADQRAARALPFLARALAKILEERRPRFVCTHPFEGGHPDHDATAFAVWAAGRLAERGGHLRPAVIEMASYHLGLTGPVHQRFAEQGPMLELALAHEDRARKRRMLALHATQARTLAPFDDPVERFRVAPSYDFASRPNGGRLLYETLPLGLSGEEWTKLAAEGLAELSLGRG